MRCLKDVKQDLENYENEINELFKNNIGLYHDLDRGVLNIILNDTIDVVKEIEKDIYMINLSYADYNNTYSFMPQYYFENAVLHLDMVWERSIIMVAAIYEIDIEEIFKKKSITCLYNKIKKSKFVNETLKNLLIMINGDSKIKTLKIIRNSDEHGISSHLIEKDNIKSEKKDIEEFYDVQSGKILISLDQIDDYTNKVNYDEMGIIINKLSDIERAVVMYKQLLKMIIVELGKAFTSPQFSFAKKEYFIPTEKKFWINRDILKQSENNLKKLKKDREKFKTVIDIINEDMYLGIQSKDRYRNTIFTDCIFRTTEIMRSIHFFLGYDFAENIDENTTKYIRNELLNQEYYFDHVMIKMYSVFEKLAKFLLCKYDFTKEFVESKSLNNIYSEKAIEYFEFKNINSKIIEEFKKCIKSEDYKIYEEARNKYYHCIREFYFLYPHYDEVKKYGYFYITVVNSLIEKLQIIFEMIIKEEIEIYIKLQEKK